MTFQTTLSAIPQTVVGKKHSRLTLTQTSQARPKAWIKTLSSMYAASHVGMMAADSKLTKQLCHMTLLFTQNFYKIQINSE